MRSFHINSFGGPDSLIIKESEFQSPAEVKSWSASGRRRSTSVI